MFVQKVNINASRWISEDDACKLLNIRPKTLKDRCRCGQYNYKVVQDGRRFIYHISFSSMPQYVKDELSGNNETENKYSNAPNWAQIQADKYSAILNASQDLKGNDLEEFISSWNIENPQFKTSYPSVIRMRRRYRAFGVAGLLAQYGTKANKTTVSDELFDYFKTMYLDEGSPSLMTCWENTLGYAMRVHNACRETFPSHTSFFRRLKKEIPKQSIILARKGKSAWNRKYGGYLERDYSNIICGKVWVSDHAQIDIACLTDDGNVVFPWVTAWRDYKSGKWLGWFLQTGSPNSDHIFQTFYYAAEEYGLPEDVIIDNGKDYRCKDFAGGRRVIKVETNQAKTTSMLDELNVKVHFALPYNAQTKPIERDFLKLKSLLSKHCIGYRGGNVVERPEKLAKEIKEGKVIPFENLKILFDSFISNVLNKKPINNKLHNGLCADDLFNQEFKEKITTSKDALKLFCMRTSRIFTIGRNGIKDRELGITYWSDWMASNTGLKVYLRRDIQNYKEAWAFKADNEEFVGKIKAVNAVAALHAETISKEEFKEAMAIKKRNFKIAKSYIAHTREIPIEERYENYKTAYGSIIKDIEPRKPKVSKIANTNMDRAIQKAKEMEQFGKNDLRAFISESDNTKDDLYLFETDKILEEELKEVAYGY